MSSLALYTFGVLKIPFRTPDVGHMREFHESVVAIYQGIDQSPGYITHASATDPNEGAYFNWEWGEWGDFVVPSWYDKGCTSETTALAATFSLWADLRSAYNFVYTGLHRVALNRRYDWFEKTGRPGLVLWWTAEGTTPTWQDGVSRLEYLHENEPAPCAFTFQRPFTPDGVLTSAHSRSAQGM